MQWCLLSQRARFTTRSVNAPRACLATLVIAGALICGGSSLAAPSDSATNLSLARTYPAAELSEILIRREQWRPFPTIEDRERWQALPEAVQTYLVARGEEALQTPWPGLPATLYLGYAREGNRARFEAVYFERRALLQQLVRRSDSARLAPVVERLELSDARLAKSWGTHLNRLVMQARSPVLKDLWTLRLTQEPSAEQP